MRPEAKIGFRALRFGPRVNGVLQTSMDRGVRSWARSSGKFAGCSLPRRIRRVLSGIEINTGKLRVLDFQ
jgi:hypothetical protein